MTTTPPMTMSSTEGSSQPPHLPPAFWQTEDNREVYAIRADGADRTWTDGRMANHRLRKKLFVGDNSLPFTLACSASFKPGCLPAHPFRSFAHTYVPLSPPNSPHPRPGPYSSSTTKLIAFFSLLTRRVHTIYRSGWGNTARTFEMSECSTSPHSPTHPADELLPFPNAFLVSLLGNCDPWQRPSPLRSTLKSQSGMYQPARHHWQMHRIASPPRRRSSI